MVISSAGQKRGPLQRRTSGIKTIKDRGTLPVRACPGCRGIPGRIRERGLPVLPRMIIERSRTKGHLKKLLTITRNGNQEE